MGRRSSSNLFVPTLNLVMSVNEESVCCVRATLVLVVGHYISGPVRCTKPHAKSVPSTTQWLSTLVKPAYTQFQEHRRQVESGNLSNALAKHLLEDHPGDEGDIRNFKCEVLKTFSKPLERQVSEAVAIHGSVANKLLNSKSEWEQPAVERLVVTREPRL